VLAASGRVDGRAVFVFAQDPSFAGGSLGAAHADSVVQVLKLAGRARAPVVGFVESAGARMQEGLAALGGYGRIFREHVALSGRVPQISVICGPSAGGGSYAPALTDFVVMTPKASMFLTGPGVVQEVMGEEVDAAGLGGHKVHERNGVCQLVADTEVDAALLVRDLLDHLPQNDAVLPQVWPAVAPPGYAPDKVVPLEDRKVYDVRDVARALVDGGRLLEISPRWARTSSARSRGSTAGRRDRRQPAQAHGRRPGRRRGAEVREVRAHVRPVRHPARRSSWTPRASCPAPSRRRAASSATAPSSCTRSPRPPCRG
jgi:acetyl-CoA carboxylase carboxyltransferase component